MKNMQIQLLRQLRSILLVLRKDRRVSYKTKVLIEMEEERNMGAPEFVKYYQDGLSRKSTISGKLDYIRDALHDVGVDGAWSRTPDYSKENYLKNIMINDLSSFSDMSKYYLIRQFENSLGLSPSSIYN